MNKLNIQEILAYLPHRYPFMLVDRVLEYESGKSLLALKNVTHNEPFFRGHFPEHPVMPGVMVVEALAQAAGILTFLTLDLKPTDPNELFYFAGIDRARFKQVIIPGDQLYLHVNVKRNKQELWKFAAEARVEGTTVCQAELMIAR